MTTLDIQRRLQALGFDPGPVDGAIGPTTVAAIKAFQARHGLIVDGVVGPKTLAALNAVIPVGARPVPASAPLPPWYLELSRLMGTREVAGPGNSSTIMGWAKRLKLSWYSGDDVPWCGLIQAHCFNVALPNEPQPSNVLGARNWLGFGVPCQPVVGAVLIFWRTHPTKSWNGHVGQYAGEGTVSGVPSFRVRGGNQSDRVNDIWKPKSQLLGARWPKSVPLFGSKQIVTAGGGFSTNEA